MEERANGSNAPEVSGVFQGRANRMVSERLEIAPLTREEMELYASDLDEFADKLGLSEPPYELAPDFWPAVNWYIEKSLAYSAEDLPMCALWAIVERATGCYVGSIGFKGVPVDGESELGYGLDEPYRGRGFMTEAVGLLVAWGRMRADLRVIVAETLKENRASQRVLEKNGFAIFERASTEGDSFFWRIDVD